MAPDTNSPGGATAQTAGENRVDLPARLDVHAAVSLKSELALTLENGSAVCVAAHAPTRVSTAACQVLVAFVLTMRNMGRRVRFQSPSPQLLRAFEALGLAPYLKDEA